MNVACRTFKKSPGHAAERLLGRVNYQAQVTENQKVPVNEVKGFASALLSIFVLAGVVNRMCDVYDDPQLKQRPQWVEIEHPEIGKMHYQRPPFLLTTTPPGPSKRDPLLAEHNEYFYRELLGLSAEEYTKLVDEQVIY